MQKTQKTSQFIYNGSKFSRTLQYTKVPKSIMQSTKLSPYAKLIYSRLIYRMQLSITKDKAFYNQKGAFHYVIYQVKDLMHDTGSGKRAVINALKQLVQYGLVVKHRLMHVMELELPKLRSVTSQSAQTAPLNRINTFRNKKSIYADNTKKIQINPKTTTKDKIKQHWNNVKLRVTETNLERHYNVPKKLINSIQDTSSNDYYAFKGIIGLVFKAKKAAFNKLNHKYKQSSRNLNKYLSFEHNRCYDGTMTNKVDEDSLAGQYNRAWCSAKKIAHKVEIKHPNKYQNVFDRTIMKCLINYFYECGEFEIINQPRKIMGPNIPIFQL